MTRDEFQDRYEGSDKDPMTHDWPEFEVDYTKEEENDWEQWLEIIANY